MLAGGGDGVSPRPQPWRTLINWPMWSHHEANIIHDLRLAGVGQEASGDGGVYPHRGLTLRHQRQRFGEAVVSRARNTALLQQVNVEAHGVVPFFAVQLGL